MTRLSASVVSLAVSVILLSVGVLSVLPAETGATRYHPETVDRIKYGGFVGMDIWNNKIVALGRYDIVSFSDELQPEDDHRTDGEIGMLTGPSTMLGDTLYACGSLGITSVNLNTGMTSSVILGYPTYDIVASGGHTFVAAGARGLLELDSTRVVTIHNVTNSCNSVCIYNGTVTYTDGDSIRTLGATEGVFNMTSIIYRLRTLGDSIYVIYFDSHVEKRRMDRGQYDLIDTMYPPALTNDMVKLNGILYTAVGSSGLWFYDGVTSYTYKVDMALEAKAEGIKGGLVSLKVHNGRLLALSTGFGLGYINFDGKLENYWFDSALPAFITDTPWGIVGINDYGLLDIMTGTMYQKYFVYSAAPSEQGLYYSNEEGIYLYKDYDISSGTPALQMPLEAPALSMAWGYNRLYYTSGNSELFSLENGVPIKIWEQPEHEKIISLHYRSSQLYIGTESSVYVMSGSEDPQKIMDLGNWCFDIDSVGKHVAAAAGESGAFLYNASNSSVERINTLSSAKSCLFASGMLLVGTDRGVEIYDMSCIYQTTISTRATVFSVTVHHDCVYISTNGDGIYRIDLGHSEQQSQADNQLGKTLSIIGLLLLFIGVLALYKGYTV